MCCIQNFDYNFDNYVSVIKNKMSQSNEEKKVKSTKCAKLLANKATLRNHLLTKHQWMLDDDRPASPNTLEKHMQKRSVSKVAQKTSKAAAIKGDRHSVDLEGEPVDDDMEIEISDTDMEPDDATNLPEVQPKKMAIVGWSLKPMAPTVDPQDDPCIRKKTEPTESSCPVNGKGEGVSSPKAEQCHRPD